MAENNLTNWIIGIVIIVAVLGIIATQISNTSSTANTINENVVTMSLNNTDYSLDNDNIISLLLTGNDSLLSEGLGLDGNYSINNKTGVISILSNSTLIDYTLVANYSYYPDTYVENSTARNVIPLIMIMIILGLIGVFLKKKSGK